MLMSMDDGRDPTEGSRYEGERNELGQRHGQGTSEYCFDTIFTLEEIRNVWTRRYVGEWKNGLMDGSGRMEWIDGYSDHDNNVRNKCLNCDSYILELELGNPSRDWNWQDISYPYFVYADCKECETSFFMAPSSRLLARKTSDWTATKLLLAYLGFCGEYDGSWKNGRRHGKGIFEFGKNSANGAWSFALRYDGEWVGNLEHGEGELEIFGLYRSRYKGQWKEGNAHGQGIKIYPDESSYDGEWKNHTRDGRGIFKDSRGLVVYEGEWENDKRHGIGYYTDHNGKKKGGIWENGKIVD